MKVEQETEFLGTSSYPFKYSERYAWKLLGYFNHEEDIRAFVRHNNLQVGDRITRKIENDQLAYKVLPVISIILLGKPTADLQLPRERIRAGKSLRKKFHRLLHKHRKNVDRQLEKVDPPARSKFHYHSFSELANV